MAGLVITISTVELVLVAVEASWQPLLCPASQSFVHTPSEPTFLRRLLVVCSEPSIKSRGILPEPAQTVRRSVITLTMLPGPAISTSCAWVSDPS